MKALILIFSLLILNACNQVKSQEDASIPQYTFLKQDSTVNPKIRGIWKSIGNGYLLDARGDSILLYSYTKSFCYKEKNEYLEGLFNSQSRFFRRGDTLSIYLTDYGDKTTSIQTKKDFIRLNALPLDHMSFKEMQGMGPGELFDLFIETMEENYAFSRERNLDWKVIGRDYKSKISNETTTEKLFQLFGEIVTLTKDHHTKIINEDGRTLQSRGTPSAEIVIDSFNKQSDVKNLDEFFGNYFSHNYKNISDSLLHGNGRKVANGKLEWGSLNERIGYINIHSFAGFGSGITRKQQIDSVNFHMGNIMEALKNKDAIILDVSFNFGGYDAFGLTIASYFTDKVVHAYTSQVYNDGEFYNESEINIFPAEKGNYTKPVYLLMTDISRSAAESFAMMMNALPNVQLIGTNTLGILSGMLGKSIGPFYSTSSNQRLLTPDGTFYEVSGVEPDIKLIVFPGENVFDGHKQAIRELIAIIEKNEKSH
jgi:carboxyl-terminal processing protease